MSIRFFVLRPFGYILTISGTIRIKMQRSTYAKYVVNNRSFNLDHREKRLFFEKPQAISNR